MNALQNGNRFCPGMKPIKITGRRTFYVRQLSENLYNTSNSPTQRINSRCNAFLYYRSYDGECTNPLRPFVGRAMTPFFSYWPGWDATKMSGSNLRSARDISNIVFHQFTASKHDSKSKQSELVTFMGQFLDHNIVLSSVDIRPSAVRDIPVPNNDVFMIPHIKFSRNVRADPRGRPTSATWTRTINVLPSAVDLFGVYGPKQLSLDLREGSGGLMKTSSGAKRLLPLNYNITEFYSKMNAPKMKQKSKRSQFFIAGDARSNENPQLTVLHTLWMRNHNRIAVQLAWDFPNQKGNDNWLFENARRINQAQFQSIIYQEYLPAMIGTKLNDCKEQYECFDQSEDAGVSDIFANAAFRVGHTMVGNFIHRVGRGGAYMEPLKLSDVFFPTKDLLQRDGIEPYLLGTVWNQAQKIDNELVEALRLKLFENVKEEDGVDLVALNIQRGRDTNLPTFAAVKKRFLGTNVRSFRDITKDKNVADLLQRAYGSVSKVELYPGLLCEDHERGKPMGPTLIAVWKREFERLRSGDQYFYRNLLKYHSDIRSYRMVKDVASGRGPTMRDILKLNTDIIENDLPSRSLWQCDFTCS